MPKLLPFFILILLAFPRSAVALDPPGPNDRCPVCGMFVAPFPDWIAAIEFTDGSQIFFDGPKDLFKFYLNWPATEKRKKSAVGGIYVTEYYSAGLRRTEEVMFVIGSDILGPMGHELVPLAGLESAEGFKRDHGGTKIVSFEQVNFSVLPIH